MAGVDDCFVGQREQLVPDASDQDVHIAAGEIGPAYGIGEQRIAHESKTVLARVETDATWGMAWRVQDLQMNAGFVDQIAIVEKDVGRLRGE